MITGHIKANSRSITSRGDEAFVAGGNTTHIIAFRIKILTEDTRNVDKLPRKHLCIPIVCTLRPFLMPRYPGIYTLKAPPCRTMHLCLSVYH